MEKVEPSAEEIENEQLAQEFLKIEIKTKKAAIELAEARLEKMVAEGAALKAA